MNSNFCKILASLLLAIAHTTPSEESVLLSFNDGPKSITLTEARKRLSELRPGDSVSNIIQRLGYPDEIRVKGRLRTRDEWRRWYYGAPGEYPLIGMVELNTNLTVLSVFRPFYSWPEEPRTEPIGLEKNVRCRVGRIWRDENSRAPELSYFALVSVTNAGSKEISIEASQNSLRTLLQWEIFNSSNTPIFAIRDYPMWYHQKPENRLKLPPGQAKQDQIAIFLRDVDLGIPRPGVYRMRVGLPLNKDFIAWSDFYEFTVEEE